MLPLVAAGSLLFLAIAAGPRAAAADPPAAPAASAVDAAPTPATRFEDLVRDYDAWRAHEFPEQARNRGRPFDPRRITQRGLVPETRRYEQRKIFLDDLLAIDASGLAERDRVDYELLRRELEQAIRSFDAGEWLLAVGRLHGPQLTVPRSAEAARFERVADYEDYLARLTWLPANLTATKELLALGIERGVTPPKVVLEGVPAQFEAVLRGGLDELREPFLQWPASIPKEMRAELERRFEEEALPPILDAFRELAIYVRSEYLPKCRDSIAANEALYRFRLGRETTTSLSPQAIHELGIAEVARLHAALDAVIRRTEWFAKDPGLAALPPAELLQRFIAFLRADPRFYHTTPDDLLREYRDICKRIDAELPRYFGRLPRLPYGVRAVPAFVAPTQPTAYYEAGSLANGEAGWFNANTYALDQRPRYEMVALALHESVPGHHLQRSLAQEFDNLRDFRRDVEATAFTEGWALYAEELGIPMGLYDTPYLEAGLLLQEIWRASRLVVDTGIHAKGWTRQEGIDYLLANTALSELAARNEVDRYISWPGQACAYTIGYLAIRRLREEAEKALGERFSLRDFHDAILSEGPLPLPVLEARMQRWIASAPD